MNTPAQYRLYANSLLTDLEGATARNLPRRDVLADWLRDFLDRSARRGFSLAADEVADLTAIHDHLAVSRVISTPRLALT